MNVKNNKRSVESKNKIKTTFLAMLSDVGLDNISVKSLCKTADINRTTFYTYYDDLDDLLESMEEELTAELITVFEKNALLFSKTKDVYLIPYLNFVKENGDYFSAYFKNTSKMGYNAKIDEIIKNEISGYVLKSVKKSATAEKISYFYEAGLFALIKKWASGGFTESVEEMSEIITACIKGKYFEKHILL
ncbi:MAG: TetR family transcriptional regulator C-terminal domain-containing protein [Clostridia bacterium]|nr:TetR family transcriptional regulator C-terminal domain-containing protein [Clostridia bacterium]